MPRLRAKNKGLYVGCKEELGIGLAVEEEKELVFGMGCNNTSKRLVGEPADAVETTREEQSGIYSNTHGCKDLEFAFDKLMDNARIMFLLEQMYFISHILGRVGRLYATRSLKKDTPVVELLVDKMYGNACLLFAGSHNGLVNMVTIHSLSAIFGQQSRVNINNMPRISLEKVGRNQKKETCQDYIINLTLAQKVDYPVAVEEIVLSHIECLYSQLFGTGGHIGLFPIIYNTVHHNARIRVTLEVFCNLLNISTITRS